MNGLIFQVSKTSTSTDFKREGCAVGSQPFFVLVSAVCQFVAVTFAKDKSSLYRS